MEIERGQGCPQGGKVPSHPLGNSTVLSKLGQPPYSLATHQATDKGP